MSQVYATEPSTSGRVLLETTHGPIEIHLWCRECPATVRLFLQLALDGYYDGLVFHRIINNFLIQTGLRETDWVAWKQQNSTLAEQYLERRSLERHSRIKFNHRGQVAMALPFNESDVLLEPQFFITLDEAPYLNEKHLVFGTVASGPTVFNALRIGSVTNVNDQGQPLDMDDAPRIKTTKVVSYELEEPSTLYPGNFLPWKATKANEAAPKKKKKQRKGKRDVNVLSFGGDDELDQVDGAGMKSSHDIVGDEDGRKKKKRNTSLAKEKEVDEKHDVAQNEKEPPNLGPVYKKIETQVESKAIESKVIEGNIQSDAQSRQKKEKKKSPSVPSAVEARRLKYQQASSKSKKQREEETMAKLLAFQGKVRTQSSQKKKASKDDIQDHSLASRMAKRQRLQEENGKEQRDLPTYHGQVLDDSDSEKDEQGWLSTKFNCRQHMDQRAGGGDGRNMDDYVVIDNKKGIKKRSRDKRRHD